MIQFWSQLLLKFKEVSDVNKHSYELRQCQNDNGSIKWIHYFKKERFLKVISRWSYVTSLIGLANIRVDKKINI